MNNIFFAICEISACSMMFSFEFEKGGSSPTDLTAFSTTDIGRLREISSYRLDQSSKLETNKGMIYFFCIYL